LKNGTVSDTRTPQYYPAFDYLRVVLATVVVAEHAHLTAWGSAGNYAVQAFFALSGWLIGGILLRSSRADLPRFYFNRAARIWIPYFVAIGLLMAVSLLKEEITAKWIEIFFYDVTFVYNFFGAPQLDLFKQAMPLQGTGNHFWSICAEEQFYLLSPFLITILPSRIGRSVWFWCILSAVALSTAYWGYFGAISLGVLAAVLKHHLGEWHTRKACRAVLAGLFVLSFAAVYLGIVPYRIGAPVSSVFLVLVLAQAGQPSALAAFLGGISYLMYLNHWIGIFAANAVFDRISSRDTVYCHIAGVVIAFLVASLLYLLIDQNLRRNRARYYTANRGISVAATGYAFVAIGILGAIFFGAATGSPLS
jgi:peptidoglycan/LPS O-acetylase OafA/YrhL